MKLKICLLFALFTFSLASHAAALLQESAGAWYQTSNPNGKIQAGSMHVWFYDNGTCDAEFYLDGSLAASGLGTWVNSRFNTSATVRITDEDGWTYLATFRNGILKGTFKSNSLRPSRGSIVCSDASVVTASVVAGAKSLKASPSK